MCKTPLVNIWTKPPASVVFIAVLLDLLTKSCWKPVGYSKIISKNIVGFKSWEEDNICTSLQTQASTQKSGKTNSIKEHPKFCFIFIYWQMKTTALSLKRKVFGLCFPKGWVVLWLDEIGNHCCKVPITVAAEILLSKLDLHCAAPTQLKGAIYSSTYSLMLKKKKCWEIERMFYNNHPASGSGNTLSQVLCKMHWELVFHMRYLLRTSL